MAGVAFSLATDEISTTTSTKTICQIIAASNHRVLLNEWSISFKGITNSAAPIKVDILRQTTAGTSGSAANVRKGDSTDDETIQTTANQNFSAEPTASDILRSYEIHPQTGFVWQAPYGKELIIPGGSRLGIRVTAGADISCIFTASGDE